MHLITKENDASSCKFYCSDFSAEPLLKMPPTINSKVVGIAVITGAVGGTLIAFLATLLRRRKKQIENRPDVLNEAHPLDLALHGMSTSPLFRLLFTSAIKVLPLMALSLILRIYVQCVKCVRYVNFGMRLI